MEPQILGDYALLKRIGQGTLGAVWLAEHRFLKRQFAIKILPEELATDRAFIQRFEDNVSMLATLEHPNLVKIHNVSFSQGHYFLVCDCIVDQYSDTRNLWQHLQVVEDFEEEELFKHLLQLADALDYAHGKRTAEKGLIHLGIKLNNILVGKNAQGAAWFLSDFGLSRIVGMDAVLLRTFKTVAETLGQEQPVQKAALENDFYPSPAVDINKIAPLQASFLQNLAFLSPEQKYRQSQLDYRSDIYAFGVLVYYLLMRHYPEGMFELPSSKLPHYQGHWDHFICSCLKADPNKRPEKLVTALLSIKEKQKSTVTHAWESLKKVDIENHSVDNDSRPLEEPSASEISSEAARMASLYQMKVEHADDVKLSEPVLTCATIAVKTADTEVQEPVVLKPVLARQTLERPSVDHDPAAALIVDNTVKVYRPEKKEVCHVQPLLSDMAVVKAGSYWRGSKDGNRDELPRHQVVLSSFAMDIHQLTYVLFVRFLEAMGGEKDSQNQDLLRLRDSRIKRSAGKLSIESGYAKHPVVGVTWYGAIAYAKWVGKRLPTEAEWEIAATGGDENFLFPTGDDIEKTQANFFSSDTTPVMSYAPNGMGIYDLAGNVYEWCYDWYGYNYYETSVQEPDNPLGPIQGNYRVLRGGCWKSLKEDLRCSRRHRNNPGTVNSTYGFRCVADAR